MKVTIKRPVVIDVRYVRVSVPINYGDEDMPADLFGRTGDVWDVTIDVDSGKIESWNGGEFELHMKVCDGGSYYLLDEYRQIIGSREGDYVPDIIPGSYGDYIELSIAADGTILNWDKRPDLDDILGCGDD